MVKKALPHVLFTNMQARDAIRPMQGAACDSTCILEYRQLHKRPNCNISLPVLDRIVENRGNLLESAQQCLQCYWSVETLQHGSHPIQERIQSTSHLISAAAMILGCLHGSYYPSSLFFKAGSLDNSLDFGTPGQQSRDYTLTCSSHSSMPLIWRVRARTQLTCCLR